jgi:hypothetical protein
MALSRETQMVTGVTLPAVFWRLELVHDPGFGRHRFIAKPPGPLKKLTPVNAASFCKN